VNPFYKINLPIDNPLNLSVDELYGRSNFIDTGMALMPVEYLNKELVEIFEDIAVKIKDFVVWNWSKTKNHPIHTDGDYSSNTRKRLCGINWNFTPTTSVKFFDKENGKPYLRKTSEIDFSTSWVFTGPPRVIFEWDGPGPVIFNPQIPHQICYNDADTLFRRSITLRFQETYLSLYDKLNANDYV
jgi:hypothetical protein